MTEKPTTMPENKRVNVGNPVDISSGANLTIDCIVTGTPPITILWLHNDNKEIKKSEGNNSTITITGPTDGDNITCRADNNMGYDMATTTINVNGNFILRSYIISLYIFVCNTMVFVVAFHYSLDCTILDWRLNCTCVPLVGNF